MGITERMQSRTPMLMEAALGERLKSEYHLVPDEQVALVGILYQPGGREALKRLWQEYIDIAAAHHLPILLTTPTRRVNRERAEHFPHRDTVIADHVALLRELQGQASGEVYIGGLMGCRGDAYTGKGCLSTEESLEFHCWQAEQFRNSPVDFLMAGILPTLPEAMGLAQAMSETRFPYLISFTIQPNGCLIDGTPISGAIETIDQFVSRPPLGYMTNCVHPSILAQALAQPCNQTAAVRERFLGIQAKHGGGQLRKPGTGRQPEAHWPQGAGTRDDASAEEVRSLAVRRMLRHRWALSGGYGAGAGRKALKTQKSGRSLGTTALLRCEKCVHTVLRSGSEPELLP